MLKSIVCFCLLALITVNAVQFQLNDRAIQFLARVKSADLPESLRVALANDRGRAASDASHWCCINDQPLTTQTQTKIEYATHIVTTKTKVGYVDCGLWGWSKCSHYVSTTRSAMYTYIQTFQVPNMSACNAHEVKCCSGYILVAENCHSYSDLVAHQELFQFLSSLGLLSVPGLGK